MVEHLVHDWANILPGVLNDGPFEAVERAPLEVLAELLVATQGNDRRIHNPEAEPLKVQKLDKTSVFSEAGFLNFSCA